MTTLRDYSPVLDRLIRREVSTEVEVAGAVTYTFDAEYLGGGTDSLDDGTWVRASDTSIVIGLNDSNGIAFPVDLSIRRRSFNRRRGVMGRRRSRNA